MHHKRKLKLKSQKEWEFMFEKTGMMITDETFVGREKQKSVYLLFVMWTWKTHCLILIYMQLPLCREKNSREKKLCIRDSRLQMDSYSLTSLSPIMSHSVVLSSLCVVCIENFCCLVFLPSRLHHHFEWKTWRKTACICTFFVSLLSFPSQQQQEKKFNSSVRAYKFCIVVPWDVQIQQHTK